MYGDIKGAGEKEPGRSDDGSFADLFEESLKGLDEGEVVKGTIVSISQDTVVVDIGYKSEGSIPIGEFLDNSRNIEVEVGDSVDVYIVRKEDKEGKPVISRQRAKGISVWKDIEAACKSGEALEGRISSVIKGGYFVELGGVRAFLPGSQVDLRPVKDMDSLIGKVFRFKVLNADREKENVIVSRRSILEEERGQKRQNAIASIKDGDVAKGVVKNITSYGAFLEVGGIDGLLHITDISWGKINHPSDALKVGDEMEVKVLKFDKEKVRLTLGLKQMTPDPWTLAIEKYPVGSRVSGRVVSLMDYGAFVELEEGLEGLVHISEMSWAKKIRHPSQIVKEGDVVDVMVLDVNRESRRISLGLKQIEANPWDVIVERYPVGSKVKGKIKNITDFGVFIGVDEGVDGLIHISDISWAKKIKHPSELFKEGDEVKAVVLAVDKENEKFSLGIKHLEENPWDTARKKIVKGAVVTGKVTSITDFGIFIDLAEGVEGLIRSSDFGMKGEGNPKDIFTLGEEVTAEVVKVNNKERRIALSIKAYELSRDKNDLKKFVESQGNQSATLGDILKTQLGKEEEE